MTSNLTDHNEITGAAIAAAARSLVGIPFSHQGRDPNDGLDCAGVLVATFAELGVELKEERPTYRKLPDEDYVRSCLARNFAERLESPRLMSSGNILHLKFNRDRAARHLAIVTFLAPGHEFDCLVVHSTRLNGRVTEEPLRGILTQATIVGVWQLRNSKFEIRNS